MLQPDTLTLEQKIGQLMIIGFDGIEAEYGLLEMIRKYHIGGVVLFARNVHSPQQVAQLTNKLQQTAIENGNPGLFIAIDQEGGRARDIVGGRGIGVHLHQLGHLGLIGQAPVFEEGDAR